MKKLFLFFAFAAVSFAADAQNIKFASFGYDSVMCSMPDYEAAQATLRELRKQYDTEVKRTEEDFNNKYEDFLEVQGELDPTIRNKRQGELQELMAKGIAFKEEAHKLLRKAEKELLAPVHARIKEALDNVAWENGYAFVLNTDNNAVPYTDPDMCEDITGILKERLK